MKLRSVRRRWPHTVWEYVPQPRPLTEKERRHLTLFSNEMRGKLTLHDRDMDHIRNQSRQSQRDQPDSTNWRNWWISQII